MKRSFLMGLDPADDFSGWLAGLVHDIKEFSHFKAPSPF